MKPAPAEIEDAFEMVHAILDPHTHGDGLDQDVIAARNAMQGLFLLRQWARASLPLPTPDEIAANALADALASDRVARAAGRGG